MIKQVIVIRSDLKMRRGKEIAQGAHASGECLWALHADDPMSRPRGFDGSKVREWRKTGMTKICCRIDSEVGLDEIKTRARKAGIPCYVITDAGKTEFNGVPTKTCLAIGPDDADRIDKITGDLKLY